MKLLETARNCSNLLEALEVTPTMQIRAPARRLWRPLLESGAPYFCRFRAAERAVWSIGRARTATSRSGIGARGNVDHRAK
eukprot:5026509-Alexandrium_andersonii.AAC.1